MELTSKEKIELTIPEDIQTLPIQIKMQSNNVAEEEQQFFLPDETIETDKKRYLENNMPKNEPKSHNNPRSQYNTHPQNVFHTRSHQRGRTNQEQTARRHHTENNQGQTIERRT